MKLNKEDNLESLVKKIGELAGEVRGDRNCPFDKLEKSAARAIRSLQELKKNTEGVKK